MTRHTTPAVTGQMRSPHVPLGPALINHLDQELWQRRPPPRPAVASCHEAVGVKRGVGRGVGRRLGSRGTLKAG